MRTTPRLIILFLLVVCLLLGGLLIRKKRSTVNEEATVVLKQMEGISRLMVVQGHFAEVYTFKEIKEVFYGLIPQPKKVIVVVEAKAVVGYDLNQLKYNVDRSKRTLRIDEFPEPIVTLEPKVEFYDVDESTFNKFTPEDYTKANERAIANIRKKVAQSGLYEEAEKRLQMELEALLFTTDALGWDVEAPTIPPVE